MPIALTRRLLTAARVAVSLLAMLVLAAAPGQGHAVTEVKPQDPKATAER